MERDQALMEVESLGRIVFRAVNTKKQKPVKVCPLNDKTGKLYTGQGEKGYFDHRTVYTVEDGNVLDLSDPYDASLWKWIRKHPYIGATREECTSNRDAVYYVDNPQKKAESFVSKDKKVVKTKTLVYNAPAEQQVILAKALGLTGAEGLSPKRVE